MPLDPRALRAAIRAISREWHIESDMPSLEFVGREADVIARAAVTAYLEGLAAQADALAIFGPHLLNEKPPRQP